MKSFFLLLASLLSAMPAHAIIGGTTVFDPSDPIAKLSVLVFISRPGNKFELCSGILISKRSILTAGHCVTATQNGTDQTLSPDQVEIYFGIADFANSFFGVTVSSESGPPISVAAIHLHPLFQGGDSDSTNSVSGIPTFSPGHQPQHDIAVVVLSKDAPSGSTPATLLPTAESLQSSEQTQVAGYGADITLRTTVLDVANSSDYPGLIELNSANTDTMTNTCQGDSGGPAFLEDQSGNIRVWGILSLSDCLQYSYYTDIRPYLPWISSVEDQ